MTLQLKLSCIFCCYWLLLLLSIEPPPTTIAEIYKSRNECVSLETTYEINYQAREFVVYEDVIFHVLSPVKNCYFYAENFTMFRVLLFEGKKQLKVALEEVDKRSIAVSQLSGAFFRRDQNYTVKFSARKPIQPVAEGLVFKVYRDMLTMKMSWYSIVNIGPASCGKVYICINSLRSMQKLRIIAVHPKTHTLFCPGRNVSLSSVSDYLIRSECEMKQPVSVNNMHFSVANFHSMHFDGAVKETSPHRLSLVGPKDVVGNLYFDMVEQFFLILKIYSMLLLTTNIKPFDVYIYVLPNNEIEEPLIRGGICYFSFDNVYFDLNVEENVMAYTRCLLHQGFMVHRRSNSWSLSYAAEGLFERYLATFEVFQRKMSYFRDCIEGDQDDLAALSQYGEDWTRIRTKRPYRKAAGFFAMLASVSANYGRETYPAFTDNVISMENNHTEFYNWITEHHTRLGISLKTFTNVIDTWTMAPGYLVIYVERVMANQSVCVSQYSEGVYLRSYTFPVQVDFSFPNVLHSRTIWVHPKSSDNCARVELNLYPYLINSYLNMVGRVNYDIHNWKAWSRDIMLAAVRTSLTPMQRVSLVTDALFFAGQRKLSYSIALKFLFAIHAEESEEAWRNFDKTLAFLEARVRYTTVYTLYRKTVSQLVERYYNISLLQPRPCEMAYKWSCMMGSGICLKRGAKAVEDTLVDHRFRYAPEVLCGGMRKLKRKKFRDLLYTMGRPDFREPEFYVQMMLCSEDPKILRELMHHLFFRNSWRFRKKKLTDMLVKMVAMSKTGSNTVFTYVAHDPVGMLRVLGPENMVRVLEELSRYSKENHWFVLFMTRMKRKGYMWEGMIEKEQSILERMRENKRWHNTQYDDVRKFFVNDFGRLITTFQDVLHMDEDLIAVV